MVYWFHAVDRPINATTPCHRLWQKRHAPWSTVADRFSDVFTDSRPWRSRLPGHQPSRRQGWTWRVDVRGEHRPSITSMDDWGR